MELESLIPPPLLYATLIFSIRFSNIRKNTLTFHHPLLLAKLLGKLIRHLLIWCSLSRKGVNLYSTYELGYFVKNWLALNQGITPLAQFAGPYLTFEGLITLRLEVVDLRYWDWYFWKASFSSWIDFLHWIVQFMTRVTYSPDWLRQIAQDRANWSLFPAESYVFDMAL